MEDVVSQLFANLIRFEDFFIENSFIKTYSAIQSCVSKLAVKGRSCYNLVNYNRLNFGKSKLGKLELSLLQSALYL